MPDSKSGLAQEQCLRQLFDHHDGKLAVAFDDLLGISGLWGGMRITMLVRVHRDHRYERSIILSGETVG